MKAKKTKRINRVRGRVKNVDVLGGLWTFELTKAGLVVHRRNSRRKSDSVVSFARLVAGGGVDVFIGGVKMRFTLDEGGLEVFRGKVLQRTMTFDTLDNLTRVQPDLFLMDKPTDRAGDKLELHA